MTQTTQLQQGGQQLLVVLHEPKEAAALARAIKQEARNERGAAAPAEFISENALVTYFWTSYPLHEHIPYGLADLYYERRSDCSYYTKSQPA